jgi:predicted phosphodiesterase
MKNKVHDKIISDALGQLHHLPSRTIARYILHNYGEYFDGSLEKIRSSIRYKRGAIGDFNRKYATHRKPQMPMTKRYQRPPFKINPGLYLICADIHAPYHEPKPIESMLKFAQQNKVTGKALIGDVWDCESLSYWGTSRKKDYDAEICTVIDILDLLNHELPTKNNIYLPGNHEFRLSRRIQTSIPEIVGLPLAMLDEQLGLEARGFELLEYNQIIMAGKLPVIHGHEVRQISRAVNPARGLFLKTKTWSLCAHCHTSSMHTAKDINDTILTTWSIGCLCDLKPDYNPYGNDWNWGFALVNVERDGNFEVENRRILANGKVV